MKSYVRLSKRDDRDQQRSSRSHKRDNARGLLANVRDPRLLLSDSSESGIGDILLMQKTVGNRVVAASLAYPVQASLKISSPNDPAELEAERIAESIMEMPDRLEEEEELGVVHRSGDGDAVSVDPTIEREIASLDGAGDSLPDSEREFFESRMGYDFGSVRVHIGGKAERLAQSVQARAFTYGQHIVFGPGEYHPGTPEGRRLLAHELTHVIQQGTAKSKLSRRQQTRRGDNFYPFVARQADETTAAEPDRTYTPGPGEERPAERTEERPPEKLYNFTFLGKEYTNLTKPQVIRALQDAYVHIKIKIDSGIEGHKYMQKIREEHWIVGWISDTVGGVSMPSLFMWTVPQVLLVVGKSALDAGNIQAAARALARADAEAVKCHRRLYEYREGTISGANITVTGLQVVEVAGAVAATVATGGAASGFWASAAVGAATAGGYSMLQGTAEQAGAVAVGMQKEFDFRKILMRGAKDAVAGLVGGIVGGALSQTFVKAMGPYIGKGITDAELAAMGMTREEFLTAGQRILPKVLGDVGATPLTTATNIVFDRVSHGGPVPKSMDELLSMIAQEAEKAGLSKLIAESVAESMK